MEAQLLTSQRQCEEHDTPNDEGAPATEIISGPWIFVPGNDPNTFGTSLPDPEIPEQPNSILDQRPDGYYRLAEHLVFDGMTDPVTKDKFKATEEWTAWRLYSFDVTRINGSGRKWTESSEVVIVRQRKNKIPLQ